ncbi:MAG: respiratory nitrate reductase subunit gamma [Deltaproteobacteria bacterium]|jgi:nitrate reductase gamma subunit|nr:respiratory nitrate reductase subunit gamma [Deltaproteobacteria bacterium]
MSWDNLAFVAFPYISLTTFTVGHAYRYIADPFHWNSRSSEILEKDRLQYASVLFHYGIVFTFLGHFAGLLVPQSFLTSLGITPAIHMRIAVFSGMIFGLSALVGAGLLLRRRLKHIRVFRHSSKNDVATIGLLTFVIALGTYNVFFSHCNVLDTVAPWIRSILILSPDPGLMASVPFTYRLHIVAALALLGLSPFSRLIHIWSVPVPYLFRSHIVFRKRQAE